MGDGAVWGLGLASENFWVPTQMVVALFFFKRQESQGLERWKIIKAETPDQLVLGQFISMSKLRPWVSQLLFLGPCSAEFVQHLDLTPKGGSNVVSFISCYDLQAWWKRFDCFHRWVAFAIESRGNDPSQILLSLWGHHCDDAKPAQQVHPADVVMKPSFDKRLWNLLALVSLALGLKCQKDDMPSTNQL